MNLSEDLRSKIAELDRLKIEFSHLEEENANLKQNNERLDRQNLDKSMEIETLRAQVHRMGTSDNEMLQALQKEKIDLLEEEKQKLQERVDELEKEKEGFESEIL